MHDFVCNAYARCRICCLMSMGPGKDEKPYQEGFTYNWMDGSDATFKNHQWEHVPGLPTENPNMEGQMVTLKDDPYRVLTGGKAQVKNGKWVPIKIKNTVRNPDAE